MKKVILLIAALMLFSSTAFGAPTDGTSSWIMTIPAQTASAYTLYWVPSGGHSGFTTTSVFSTRQLGTSVTTFNLIVSGGGTAVQFVETNNATTYPDLEGTGTIAGAGPYTATTNATSGSFVTTDFGQATTVEITLLPFTLSTDEQTITNGTMMYLFGGSVIWAPVAWTATREVPIPAAFWLLASGLAGLAAVRRRK